MEWRADLEIGVEEIDRQHRDLIERINLFRRRWRESPDNIMGEMGDVLSFLVDYVNYHFISEESIMESYAYPGLEIHRREHQALVNELAGILKGLRAGKLYRPEELYLFLSDWLNTHIIKSDLRLGSYIGDRVASSPIEINSPEDFYDFYLSGLKERLASRSGDGQSLLKGYLRNFYSSVRAPTLRDFSHILFSLELLEPRGLIRDREELNALKKVFLSAHPLDSYGDNENERSLRAGVEKFLEEH